jgi:hypothetical protein
MDFFGIYLQGVETASTMASGGTAFLWNLKNDQSQAVGGGVYYLKIEQVDSYGHKVSYIREVSVLAAAVYTELRIYNGAGELVSVMRNTGAPAGGQLKIETGETAVVGVAGGAGISVVYGPGAGDNFIWDGRNLAGKMVSNGSYEFVIVSDTGKGEVSQLSKSINILSVSGAALAELPAVWPNPFRGDMAAVMRITWLSGSQGTVNARIYNAAGELVRKLKGSLQAQEIIFDGRTESGLTLSRGIYVAVLDLYNTEGKSQVLSARFAILSPAEW